MAPLISAADLLETLEDPDLRVCDVRWTLGQPGAGRAAYSAGHIPGAAFVDLDTDLSQHRSNAGRHPLPDAAWFAWRMGQLGIGSGHTVVAYDDGGATTASRLWWMLDALGHQRCRVLDGGLKAWLAAGGPLATDASVHPPARLELASAWPRTIDRTALAARLGSLTLLDVRAPERYRGEVEPIDPVAGHIPTALNAPVAGNVGADARFLPADDLRARYARFGADAGTDARPVVVACGSGITACQAALAMRVAGVPDPLLYPGSWSDWSSAGMPVMTGGEPGQAPRGPAGR